MVPVHAQVNNFFLRFYSDLFTILGDSGSGLFIEYNKVFYLRGFVSLSLFDNGDCDVSNYAIYTNVLKYTEWIKYPSGPTCGTTSASTSLILGGSFASQQDFPWAVAVINNAVEPDKNFYLVTGTLISERHVVVPTSFVVFKQKGDVKPVVNFKMYFGISKLKHIKKSAVPVETGVSGIIVHDGYTRGELPKEANLAIMFADQIIKFSDQIQPACLPSYRENSIDIYGKSGYVVGWGYDETATFSKKKKSLKVRVDDQRTCYSKWKQRLDTVKTSKVFCATPTRSGAPCTADGPFYIKLENKWFFRGWLGYNGTCDPTEPSIYEDIAFYSQWIEKIITT